MGDRNSSAHRMQRHRPRYVLRRKQAQNKQERSDDNKQETQKPTQEVKGERAKGGLSVLARNPPSPPSPTRPSSARGSPAVCDNRGFSGIWHRFRCRCDRLLSVSPKVPTKDDLLSLFTFYFIRVLLIFNSSAFEYFAVYELVVTLFLVIVVVFSKIGGRPTCSSS